MKNLFTFLFICFLNSASAATYYLSASSGDDARTATQAQNPSTPWKTLAKLNSFFPLLQPGDQVLLKRGDNFNGTVIISKSGTSTAPISIGSYGDEFTKKPLLNGFSDVITNWTSSGNGIYKADLSGLYNTSDTLMMLTIDGKQYGEGRFPNTSYYLAGAGNTTTSVNVSEFATSLGTNWTGGNLVGKGRRWELDRYRITGHSGSTLTYTDAGFGSAPVRMYRYAGVFITHHLKTLDKFGEWFHSAASDDLSVHFGTSAPTSFNVRMATRQDLIKVASGVNNIVIKDLSLTGANRFGINLDGGSGSTQYINNMIIRGCDFDLMGRDAVFGEFTFNVLVENCKINRTNNNGIKLNWFQPGDKITIRNNIVDSVYLIPGAGQNTIFNGHGIMAGSPNTVIENNYVTNQGYCGIRSDVDHLRIRNNFVDNVTLVKDDGGAIYSWGIEKSSVVTLDKKITDNIILNARGNADGVAKDDESGPETAPIGVGIYIDDYSNHVEVARNSAAGNAYGIYLHNSWNMNVHDNTCYNNGSAILYRRGAPNEATDMYGNSVNSNIFFARLATQYAIRFATIKSYVSGTGNLDNNWICRPINEDGNVITYRNSSTGGNYVNVTHTTWKSVSGYEGTSTRTPKTITTLDDLRFEYNATTTAKTIPLDATYVDAKNNQFSGSLTLQPYSSAVLIRTSTVTNVAPVVSITSPVANATFAAPTSVTITADATDASGVSKVDFYNGTTLLGTDNTSPYSFTWNNVAAGSYTITAKATDNTGLTTTSAPVAISVNAVNTAPTVSLTSPVANTSFAAPASVTMTATAADTGGSIAKVEFYNGSTLLKTELTSPYSFTCNDVAAGNYTITAKATDNTGLTTTSAPVTISVNTVTVLPNVAPTVAFTGISTKMKVGSSTSVIMTAAANDVDGTVSKVEFYKGDSLLGTVTTSPYTYTWNNVAAGSYTMTAKATDDKGAVTTSSKVTISVVAPTISLRATNRLSNSNDTLNTRPLDLKVFPNPAVNQIQVRLDGLQITNQKAQLLITTVSGIVVKTIPVSLSGQTIQTDVSSLSQGMYIVTIVSDHFKASRKFIKN